MQDCALYQIATSASTLETKFVGDILQFPNANGVTLAKVISRSIEALCLLSCRPISAIQRNILEGGIGPKDQSGLTNSNSFVNLIMPVCNDSANPSKQLWGLTTGDVFSVVLAAIAESIGLKSKALNDRLLFLKVRNRAAYAISNPFLCTGSSSRIHKEQLL
jgi:hypothetical protein